MNRVLALVGTAALAVTFPGFSVHAASSRAPAPRVAVTSVKPTTVSAKHGAVTFRLRITGITLDARNIGKKNLAGHGHIQLYVDKIPADAYRTKDLKHHWLASLAAPTFGLDLKPAILGGKGKHTIFIALAMNDSVLYNVPTARVTITAR